MNQPLEKNIFIYPWFIASSSLLFWFPVFFLYFSSKVTIDQVLLLEAIYYACVVLLELPSGYLSDLLGRRITLLVSSVCALCSYVIFVIADGFTLLMLAQALLAAHISFKSGTDSSLLYESLAQSSRESEIGEQLARAQRMGLLATALAALIGGFFGGFKLSFAYGLSALSAAAVIILALKFSEPEKSETTKAHAVLDQLKVIITYLKLPKLAWLFIFSVLIFVLIHVPYEYFQAYIKLLFPATSDYDKSPMVAGILIALTMLAGSYASNYSIPLQNRYGTGTALLIIIVFALTIIGIMALVLSNLVLLMILMRSVPMALSTPIVDSVLHQNIDDTVRASFMSARSLFSRLAFSLTLVITAVFTGSIEQLGFAQLQLILGGYIALTVLLLPVLWTVRKKLD